MSGTQDNPPPLTEPLKRAGYEIEKNWHHLTAAPLAFLSIAGVGVLLGYLFEREIVVAGKNATIETLSVATAERDKTIDRLEKEKATLEKQNTDLKTAIAESAAPLKKRTLILADQLATFTQQFTNGTPFERVLSDYQNRFPVRNERIALQFDDAGQHSAIIQHLLHSFDFYDPHIFITNVTTLSREFRRLANNLNE